MLSMSMKEFWIILQLQEKETDGIITDVQAEHEGKNGAIGSSHL